MSALSALVLLLARTARAAASASCFVNRAFPVVWLGFLARRRRRSSRFVWALRQRCCSGRSSALRPFVFQAVLTVACYPVGELCPGAAPPRLPGAGLSGMADEARTRTQQAPDAPRAAAGGRAGRRCSAPLAGRLYYLQVVQADRYRDAGRREPHQHPPARAAARPHPRPLRRAARDQPPDLPRRARARAGRRHRGDARRGRRARSASPTPTAAACCATSAPSTASCRW